MNFNHLKVFMTVAKTLNYSRAAEELYLSQPTVSVQVKKLEEDLGLELFEQMGKKIYLTEAGEILYTYAKKLFALADEAHGAMEELKGLKRGKIVVGASSTPGIYLLPRIIKSFEELNPGVEIILHISNTHAVQEALLANRLDLGVVGEEITANANLVARPLATDELVAIVSPLHPSAKTGSVTIRELLKQKLLLRERGSSTREVLEERLRGTGLELKAAMTFGSVEAIKQAVSANLGVSIISLYAVEVEVKAGTLAVLRIPGLNLQRRIHLVYHAEKRFSPLGRAFIDYLPEAMEKVTSRAN